MSKSDFRMKLNVDKVIVNLKKMIFIVEKEGVVMVNDLLVKIY